MNSNLIIVFFSCFFQYCKIIYTLITFEVNRETHVLFFFLVGLIKVDLCY